MYKISVGIANQDVWSQCPSVLFVLSQYLLSISVVNKWICIAYDRLMSQNSHLPLWTQTKFCNWKRQFSKGKIFEQIRARRAYTDCYCKSGYIQIYNTCWSKKGKPCALIKKATKLFHHMVNLIMCTIELIFTLYYRRKVRRNRILSMTWTDHTFDVTNLIIHFVYITAKSL